jgi:hypothetical protein
MCTFAAPFSAFSAYTSGRVRIYRPAGHLSRSVVRTSAHGCGVGTADGAAEPTRALCRGPEDGERRRRGGAARPALDAEMSEPASRLAENETAFRTFNEGVGEVEHRVPSGSGEPEFVCECSNPDCTERVRMPLNGYKRCARTHCASLSGISEEHGAWPRPRSGQAALLHRDTAARRHSDRLEGKRVSSSSPTGADPRHHFEIRLG